MKLFYWAGWYWGRLHAQFAQGRRDGYCNIREKA